MAHDKLTHGMALSGYIRLRDHKFAHIYGLTPVVDFYHVQAPLKGVWISWKDHALSSIFATHETW